MCDQTNFHVVLCIWTNKRIELNPIGQAIKLSQLFKYNSINMKIMAYPS